MTLAAYLPVRAAETPDPDESKQAQAEYEQATSAYQDALAKFQADYRQAKTATEQAKLVAEQYPTPAKFGSRFLEIAQRHPDTPGAIQALTWIVVRDPNHRFHGVQPLEILHTRYLQSDQLGPACLSLTYGGNSFLQDVLTRNPARNVRGAACLSLGAIARRADNAGEAERFFQRAMTEFADVPTYGDQTVGEQAGNALFEMHHLAVGCPAPEIVGTDADGKEFRLSDYRGKVVVLDFWGRW